MLKKKKQRHSNFYAAGYKGFGGAQDTVTSTAAVCGNPSRASMSISMSVPTTRLALCCFGDTTK